MNLKLFCAHSDEENNFAFHNFKNFSAFFSFSSFQDIGIYSKISALFKPVKYIKLLNNINKNCY